jgi:diguanylate cyclase (GGDEF)-like protein
MSWLCPTELDRRRAVDTSERVRRARTLAAVCSGVGILVMAPLISWWLVPLFVLALINVGTVDVAMRRSETPELPAARGMLVTALILAAGAAITGGPESPMLPWMIIPVAMAGARFGQHVVIAGVGIAVALVVGLGLAVNPAALVAHPELTVVTVTLILSVAAIVVAIQGAEVQHRLESVLDPLTGLLNRKSLLPRFEELQMQARQQHAPICMIAADLDHFKEVNDTFGHETGDAVLRESAYEMRKCLRSFELFYRLGGEEFLVVVPGADLDQGRELAERMRETVERIKPAGVAITVSLGVAVAAGNQLDFEQLFNAADQALYEAKHAGRNRIASIEVREEAGVRALEQLVAVESARA